MRTLSLQANFTLVGALSETAIAVLGLFTGGAGGVHQPPNLGDMLVVMTGEWKYHEYTIIYYYHIIIYYYILLYFHGGRCLFSLIFTTFQTPRGLGQGDILIGRRFDGTDYSCPPCMRGEWQEDGQRLFFICQFAICGNTTILNNKDNNSKDNKDKDNACYRLLTT